MSATPKVALTCWYPRRFGTDLRVSTTGCAVGTAKTASDLLVSMVSDYEKLCEYL